MARKVEWDWESHLTNDQKRDLASWSDRSDALLAELQVIADCTAAIRHDATARAKAAGSKVRPFVL